MRFPFLNNRLLIYKILALCGEQKVFQKENCFSNLTGWTNSF